MSRTEMSQTEPRWSRFSPEGPRLRPRRAPCLPSSSRRTQLRLQVLQSHQVEAGAGEGEHRPHLLLSPMPEFTQTPGHLHPAEGLFHDLAPALTCGVALQPVVLWSMALCFLFSATWGVIRRLRVFLTKFLVFWPLSAPPVSQPLHRPRPRVR